LAQSLPLDGFAQIGFAVRLNAGSNEIAH
jgi:hypothetical protein